jgi:hypothetical protein
MPNAKTVKVKWTEDGSEDDYRAAEVYLSLIDTAANVNKAVAGLRAAGVDKFKAADLLRASQVKLPKSDDRPCRKEIKKINKGEALSPVLLVRDAAMKKVIIADGFHRICAAYRIDPDVILHCKIV